jgi:AcrR family transcriptional regulator
MVTSTDPQTDGRMQRSERSREAIVQAMLDLIGEGTLVPTAQQVAERADVGVRTVFRHFSDMETLFAAMNERLRAEAQPLLVREPQTGPVAERLRSLLERRIAFLSTVGPYEQSSSIQRWRSEFLEKEHESTTRALERDLRFWLPECAQLDRETVAALELSLATESWNRLRTEQKLSAKRAAAVLERIVRALTSTLPGLEPSPHD